jgi:hypothetical protein
VVGTLIIEYAGVLNLLSSNNFKSSSLLGYLLTSSSKSYSLVGETSKQASIFLSISFSEGYFNMSGYTAFKGLLDPELVVS